jgi:hypothetical protein
VGRIIARPFIGPNARGAYTRTHRRRDFALAPTEPTVLDRLGEIGVTTYGIGKIGEIFAWQGVCESPHSENNMHGFDKLVERVGSDTPGFVFANLVDFDMIWGHRNDAEGYARGLEAVDARMPELLDAMIDGDLLIITADHGCDPTTESTDHSREYTPLIVKVKGSTGVWISAPGRPSPTSARRCSTSTGYPAGAGGGRPSSSEVRRRDLRRAHRGQARRGSTPPHRSIRSCSAMPPERCPTTRWRRGSWPRT